MFLNCHPEAPSDTFPCRWIQPGPLISSGFNVQLISLKRTHWFSFLKRVRQHNLYDICDLPQCHFSEPSTLDCINQKRLNDILKRRAIIRDFKHVTHNFITKIQNNSHVSHLFSIVRISITGQKTKHVNTLQRKPLLFVHVTYCYLIGIDSIRIKLVTGNLLKRGFRAVLRGRFGAKKTAALGQKTVFLDHFFQRPSHKILYESPMFSRFP